MKSAIFKIEGMNCDVCANTIKGLVEKEAGVQIGIRVFRRSAGACAL